MEIKTVFLNVTGQGEETMVARLEPPSDVEIDVKAGGQRVVKVFGRAFTGATDFLATRQVTLLYGESSPFSLLGGDVKDIDVKLDSSKVFSYTEVPLVARFYVNGSLLKAGSVSWRRTSDGFIFRESPEIQSTGVFYSSLPYSFPWPVDILVNGTAVATNVDFQAMRGTNCWAERYTLTGRDTDVIVAYFGKTSTTNEWAGADEDGNGVNNQAQILVGNDPFVGGELRDLASHPLSTDATLSALSLSSGTLSPQFSSSVTSYSASVANSVSSLTVTPTTNHRVATVKVNGVAVSSGSASTAISLSVGNNTITVTGTAADTTTTKIYTLTVTRAAAAPTISSVSPNRGSTNGHTLITLAGTGFSGSSITLDGQTCTSASVSGSEITCFTPAHATGTVSIQVTNGDGQSATLSSGFTYVTGDAWSSTDTTSAPAARKENTAVWTGSRMVVWGGRDGSGGELNSGGAYNPVNDSWTSTSTVDAPAARHGHSAVWTGSKMIIWGGSTGSLTNSGGVYDPGTDTWTATSTSGAVPVAVLAHTAIWTGSKMIIWGGVDSTFTAVGSGAAYDPSTNSWTSMASSGAPSARWFHSAVWTGSEMLIWGGTDGTSKLSSGARYNPSTNTWAAMGSSGAPLARYQHAAVWAETEMIVWGGADTSDMDTGGRYSLASASWTATSTTNVPTARTAPRAVWTGYEMLIWGGQASGTALSSGGRYLPTLNTWSSIATSGAPVARTEFSMIWSGFQMIVWGGATSGVTNTGGAYVP